MGKGNAAGGKKTFVRGGGGVKGGSAWRGALMTGVLSFSIVMKINKERQRNEWLDKQTDTWHSLSQ